MALQRGHPVTDLWVDDVFSSSNLPTPKGKVYPLAGTILGNLREHPLDSGVDEGVVVCFASETDFHSLITISSVDEATRNQMIADAEALLDFGSLWTTHGSGPINPNLLPVGDYDPNTASADTALVVLPRFFPLPRPSPFPPGILGDVKAFSSVDKLAEVVEFFCAQSREPMDTWLSLCPLMYEWLHAAHAHPDSFCMTWLGKAWIENNFRLNTLYDSWDPSFDPAPFRTQHDAHLLQTLLLTQSWRIHLDRLFGTICMDPESTTTKRFHCYLERAHDQAFSLPASPLGSAPRNLLGELVYLHPPNWKSWATTLGLQRFIDPAQRLPMMVCQFFKSGVEVKLTIPFESSPLLTIVEVQNLGADTADDDANNDSQWIAPTPEELRVVNSIQRRISFGRRPSTIAQNMRCDPDPIDLSSPPPIPKPKQSAAKVTDLPPSVPHPKVGHDFFHGRTVLTSSPTRGCESFLQSGSTLMGNRGLAPLTLGQSGSSTLFANPSHNLGFFPPAPQASRISEAPVVAASSSETTSLSDPSTWSLSNISDQKQPSGFRVFSALLAVFKPDYDACYVGSDRPVEPLSRMLPLTIWDVYCSEFLAAQSPTDARHWLHSLALDRAFDGSSFRPTTPHFNLMPIAVVDAFRQGTWRQIDSIRDVDELSTTFSLLSMLSWVDRRDSRQPRSGLDLLKFTDDGVWYNEAKQLLQNFIWLIVSPSLLGRSSLEEQRQIQTATPLIFAFDKLFQAIFLRGSGWQGISPKQIWDADPSSRLRFTLRMIRDIELILELYGMIIRPFERPKIFWETYENQNPHQRQHVLWSFYPNDRFPDAVLSPAKDPPNLVQAVNTIAMSFEADWRIYLSKDGHGLESPQSFLCVSSPSGSSRKQEGAPPADQPAAKRQKSGSDQGKNPSHRISSATLLQWVLQCAPEVKNRAGISALFRKHLDAIPKVKTLEQTPAPAPAGLSLCFPFIIKGLGCKCQGRALKQFAHVDISDTRWKPVHLSDLPPLLAIDDVGQMLTFTEKGRTFFAA